MRRDIRLSANRRKRFLREIRSISTSGKSKKVNKRKILVKIAYCKKCDKPLKGIPTMPLSGIRIIKVLAKELCNKCARTKKKINLVKIGNKIVKSKPAGIINEKTDIERILDLAWQSGEKIRRKISKGSIIRKKQ
jgi:hypothetical protein